MTTNIKLQIAHCADIKLLSEWRKQIETRLKLLGERRAAQAADAAWETAKTWQRGQKLYCCSPGTFLGGPIQRGSELTVYALQPRKKIVWFSMDDGKSYCYWMSPSALVRYSLKTSPPENPVSEETKKLAQKMGETINSVL